MLADSCFVRAMGIQVQVFFYQKSSHVPSFIALWKDVVRHQLLGKGAQLIKDAKKLDPIVYSDFIYALISFKKRLG